MKKKRVAEWLGGTAGLVLVFAILVAVNVVVGAFRIRRDLTEEKLYTLSGGTRDLLGGLERPVTLKFYFSRSNERVPAPIKHYAQRVNDLLREYAAHSRGRIELESYDPRPDSEEEEWAQRYGLAGQPLGFMGGDEDLYLGLVALSGAREATLPFLAPGMEPQLEYLVTRLIHEVTREGVSRIGLLSSLPLAGSQPMPFGGPPPEPSWIVYQQLDKEHDIQMLSPETGEIDPTLDAVVLVHPKDLPESFLYALDRYLLDGGRLLAFLDPYCLAEQESGPMAGQHAFLMGGYASDLNRLTEAWGITMDAGSVAADPRAATRVGGPDGRPRSLPTWLSLRGEAIEREDIATASLDFLMLPFAGVFSGEPADGLSRTVLLRASDDTVLLDAFMAMNPTVESARTAPRAGGAPLALRLQGRFPSAFPEGAPGGDSADGEDGESPPPAKPAESRREGVAVLVGDADLLYDRFAAREMNFFGQTFVEPMNDNLSFVLNMVEQVAGNEALIGLRSRGAFDRPFERVLALEQQARERWQAEEARLVEELRETQERLSALHRGAEAEDQQFILSPEQQREIEAFREKRFETQQRLQEVRRNLRADIERLGWKVKWVNLAAMPSLVALWGLAYGWRRRRRSAP